MHADSNTLTKGFTIIELIISTAIMVILLLLLLFGFKFHYDTYDDLYSSISTMDNLRFLSIILETQIRASPTIYIVNDRIYLKDMESPQYYNYYTLKNRTLYKTKTDSHLDAIGSGSTSQIAWDIDSFTFTYTDPGNIGIALRTVLEGKAVEVVKEVKIMGKVVIIEN